VSRSRGQSSLRMKAILVLVVNALSMAGMGSAIVMESSSFPYNQWLLVFCYTLGFAFLFFVTLVTICQVQLAEVWRELKQWRQYMAIGMFWSMNYVFILISAPYLPNTIQVVLAQFQCVLVAFIDFKCLGVRLSRTKIGCIALTVIFGLAGVLFSAKSSREPLSVTCFWSAVFLVNSFAGGFAQLCTEALLKLKKEQKHNRLIKIQDTADRAAHGLDENGAKISSLSSVKEVVMLNFAANCYGAVFCILGLPLALFSLKYPEGGAMAKGAEELVNLTIFADVRILYWVLMLACSFVYTIVQGCLASHMSAIYGIMASSFGSFLQLLFFLLPSLPEEFRQTFSLPAFLLSLAVTLCAFLYTMKKDEHDPLALEASVIGQYFLAAIETRPQTNAVVFAGAAVYLLSWVAMGVLLFVWETSG